MKNVLKYFILTAAAFLIFLPAASNAQGRGHGNGGGWHNPHNRSDWQWRGRRRYQGRNRYTYGYKNYGQYRRTQVGNRRFRLVRRPYWRRGVRLTRWVRVYY